MNESTFPLIHQIRNSMEDAKRKELLHHLSPQELELTLAEYARHFRLSSGERARLLAESVRLQLQDKGSRLKRVGKRAVRHAGARVAHAASDRLISLAERIERRAFRLDQEE